jgi:hypothetical protein
MALVRDLFGLSVSEDALSGETTVEQPPDERSGLAAVRELHAQSRAGGGRRT